MTMKENSMERFLGRYCKIVTQELGDEKSHAVIGFVRDIDSDAGFLVIESDHGLSCLNITTIVAIRPKIKLAF